MVKAVQTKPKSISWKHMVHRFVLTEWRNSEVLQLSGHADSRIQVINYLLVADVPAWSMKGSFARRMPFGAKTLARNYDALVIVNNDNPAAYSAFSDDCKYYALTIPVPSSVLLQTSVTKLAESLRYLIQHVYTSPTDVFYHQLVDRWVELKRYELITKYYREVGSIEPIKIPSYNELKATLKDEL